jgi:hypothetical protein
MKSLLSGIATLTLITSASIAGEAKNPKAPVVPPPPPPESGLIYDFELKSRFEYRENNFDFNSGLDTPTDDSWLLYRSRLGLGYKFSPMFKIYAQGQDAREFDSDRPNIPGMLGAEGDDPFDLRQFYIEIGNEKSGFSTKIGRQTLLYGDQRLIGPLEWNNISRTWDAAKFRYGGESWWVEGFAASLVAIDPDGFNKSDVFGNDGLGINQMLSGIYFSTTLLDFQTTDAYAFYSHSSIVDFFTVGTRWKSTPGKLGPWDYTAEFVGQAGDIGGKDLLAFAGHAELGYTFKGSWKPRLALDYAFGSGDGDADDGDVNTFQNLYPTNHLYYGYIDAFSWQNIHNINLNFKVAPTQKLSLRADFHAFWLANTNDAWYRANGVSTVRDITPGASSQAAMEVDLTASYAFTKNFTMTAGYSRLFAGDYLANTGASSDADFAYIEATLKF